MAITDNRDISPSLSSHHSQYKGTAIEMELQEKTGLPADFVPPTPEEEARVIRKLDWRLLPFIFLLYMLAVLDRSNLGNARLAGLENAINLKGWNYNWLGKSLLRYAERDSRRCGLTICFLRNHLLYCLYLLSMVSHRLESLQTSSILCLCCLPLGLYRHHSSNSLQLARNDGLPILPRIRRSLLRSRRAVLPIFLLPARQDWFPTRCFHRWCSNG